MITTMQRIVQEAGAIALQYHGGLKKNDVEFKSEVDLVTKADREIEAYIAGQLKQQFPAVRFVGEESSAEADYTQGEVFVLDPIDGTTNFVHGLPYFAISLAYMHDGQVEAGIVYAPVLNAMYAAQRGKGAVLNGQSIQASSADQLVNSIAVTGFINLRNRKKPDNIATFARAAYEVRSVLRLGSAAIDLCFVADGKIDVFWEHGLNVWDVAAGSLIVQEAGGVVTAMDGSTHYLSGQQGILAAGPQLHAAAQNLISEEWGK